MRLFLRGAQAVVALSFSLLFWGCGQRTLLVGDWGEGSSGGGSSTGGASQTDCNSDDDCPIEGESCSAMGVCVECAGDFDCNIGAECIQGACVQVDCAGDSDCSGGQVCDLGLGVCVDCIDDTSCPDGLCVEGTCQNFCDFDGECADDEHCNGGVCLPDVCEPGALSCSDDGLEECDFRGAAQILIEFCSAGQACIAEPDEFFGCRDVVCEPGSRFCDGNDIMACLEDGSGAERGTTCTAGAVCVDGECLETECDPGARFCDGSAVRQCTDDGQDSVFVEFCEAGSFCDDSMGVFCAPLVCEPDAVACDGNVVIKCNEDGTATFNVENCGMDVCVAGECKEQICTPGTRRCDGTSVRQCATDGLSDPVTDVCTASEYCDEMGATCEPQVCTPSQATCNGDTLRTCDAIGSAFASTEDCPGLCAAGACREVIVEEDFDDGDNAGWVVQGNGYSSEVTEDESPTMSGSSFTMTGGNNGHYDGAFTTFAPAIRPTGIRYFAMNSGVSYGTYMTLHDSTSSPGLSNEVAFVYFTVDSTIATGQSQGQTDVASYVPNQWYEIELIFDWDNSEYDIYVDGTLARADNQFRGGTNADEIQRISLYHYSPGSTGYWDQIQFF